MRRLEDVRNWIRTVETTDTRIDSIDTQTHTTHAYDNPPISPTSRSLYIPHHYGRPSLFSSRPASSTVPPSLFGWRTLCHTQTPSCTPSPGIRPPCHYLFCFVLFFFSRSIIYWMHRVPPSIPSISIRPPIENHRIVTDKHGHIPCCALESTPP